MVFFMAYLSSETENRMFDNMKDELTQRMPSLRYFWEFANVFTSVATKRFEESGFAIDFLGPYMLDEQNPLVARALSNKGLTTGCILYLGKDDRGIVRRALLSGLDQHIPDVTKDSDHLGCGDKMDKQHGTEIVQVGWSQPYRAPGKWYNGLITPVGGNDTDILRTDALSSEGLKRYTELWVPWSRRIFPGEAKFEPIEKYHVTRQPFEEIA